MRTLLMLVVAVAGSSCAGAHIVNPPEVARPHELKSGDRVRVHLSQPPGKIVGNVVGLSADTLVIISAEDMRGEVALSTANIRQLDLSLGRRSRAGRGALVGLLAGAVGGYVALGLLCQGSCVGAVGLYALLPAGALVGAGIGAGIGSLIRAERWQRVQPAASSSD